MLGTPPMLLQLKGFGASLRRLKQKAKDAASEYHEKRQLPGMTES